MPEKYTIGRWEVGCIIINMLIYKMFTSFPRIYPEISGTGAWLTALITGVLALIIIFIILKFYEKSGNDSILTLTSNAFGRTGEIVLSIILILYFIFSDFLAIREFSELVKIIAFPTAPTIFIMLFFLAAMQISVCFGFNSITHISVLIVPLAIVTTVFIITSSFKYVDLNNIFPLLGNGPNKTFGSGLYTISLYSDVIVLFLINPFAKAGLNIRNTAMGAAAISVILNVVVVLMFTLNIPYPTSSQVQSPIYNLLKIVYYGRFFQRIDGIYMIVLTMVGMLYTSTILYLITHIFKKAFRLDRSRPVIWPISFILVLLSIITQQSVQGYDLTKYSSQYTWIIGFLIPSIVVLSMAVKRMRGK